MVIFILVGAFTIFGATVGFEGGQANPGEKNIFTSSYHSFTSDGRGK